MELTIVRDEALCRCKNPWQRHKDGFMWSTPPDGSVHRVQVIVGTKVIEQEKRSEQSGDLSQRL